MGTSAKEVKKSHQQEFDDYILMTVENLGHAVAGLLNVRNWAHKMKERELYGKCDAYIEVLMEMSKSIEALSDELDARLAG